MIRDEHRFWRRLNNLADAIITIAAFALSYRLRDNLCTIPGLKSLGRLAPFEYYAFLMLFAAIVWPILLNHHGLYSTERINKRLANMVIIIRSSLEAWILLIAFLYIFQVADVSRILLIVFGVINCAFLIIKDNLIQLYLARRRSKGLDIRQTLIVGNEEMVVKLIPRLREQRTLGLSPVGIVLLTPPGEKSEIDGIPILGKLDQFPDVVHDNPIRQVIFATRGQQYQDIDDAFLLCVDEGIEAWVVVDYFDKYLVKAKIDTLEGLPILSFHNAPVMTWKYIIKSILDRLFALILLIILLPVLLVISLGISLTYGSPIFFRQERVGRYGRRFILYKFRTIVEDNSKWLGQWLRKTALDELPQLINILKGEMSFVGPRPHIFQEISQYKDHRQRRRLSVKPGLTGSRQISRPEKISFDQQLELDLEYIDHWSLIKDMSILVKTIPVVVGRFFGRHAQKVY